MNNPDTFPTLGILGGGQLGRMMAMAALRLAVRPCLLSPKGAGPMRAFAHAYQADWEDPDVLRNFAEECDVVTVESEWAPGDRLAEVLPENTTLWPGPETVDVIRHKGRQKDALRKVGLPVPEYSPCRTEDEARRAAESFGFPVLFKKYRGSYDGYGNATVFEDTVEQAWDELADDDGLLVERFVDFRRELSAIVVRRPSGAHAIYPITETEQHEHRCHTVLAPADLSENTRIQAREVALRAVEAVRGVGITAVELFETASGDILINELAPRPHNTGHYTIDACHTSQFENHVRAVLDWPLGLTSLRVPAAVMVNVLGHREGHPPSTNGLQDALAVPGASVHIYDKPDVREKRKMGHVTVTATDVDSARTRAEEAAQHIRL